jgi:TonB family protein
MSVPRVLALVLLALAVPAAASPNAQEEPLAAGTDGVPVPKKKKHVQPVYPQEALAQGIRGIVILDVIVGTDGRVEETHVIRSIPGLDEAAIAAARQWEYEPVKVDGKPVRVKLTVPITFALALPTIERQEGIPELRQGVSPSAPAASKPGTATAEVTLEPDGRIGVARILEGEDPWAQALLSALRTWRFGAPPEDSVLSFRVEASFVPQRGSTPARVDLRATGLQRTEILAQAAPPSAPAAAPASAPPETPAASAPAAGEGTGATGPAPAPEPRTEPTTPPAPATSPAEGAPAPPDAVPAAAEPAAPVESGAPAARPSPGNPAAPAGAAPPVAGGGAATAAPAGASVPRAPEVEVITAPPPALPPENGVSAIRDVTLEPGVPDLTRGRRPVAPPLARMAREQGTVEVEFSVGASGSTAVRSVNGPELLQPAAEGAVTTWIFRRSRADRAYLRAVFTYAGDKASAIVSPQPPPGPATAAPPPASPEPAATAPPPPGP